MSDQSSRPADIVVSGPTLGDADLVVAGVKGRKPAPASLIDQLVDRIGDPSVRAGAPGPTGREVRSG